MTDNNRIFRKILILFITLVMTGSFFFVNDIKADEEVFTARPSESGFLHVEGTKIVDEKGNTVVLRGISTHGLTWYPEYINDNLFHQLSTEWNCNFIRLPMYSKIYVEENRPMSLKVLEDGIQYAINNDMYVLVDWHILDDYDPNIYLEEAQDFFTMIAEKYGDQPNIIYEICNEPNGSTTWEDITDYANVIIPTIRKIAPASLIIVGTPDYDQDLLSCIEKPLSFDNVMYTLHFYTATHYQNLKDELQIALDHNLPVFITECGISEADGNGTVDFANAVDWFNILDENKISYAVWSLSNKAESSAFIKPLAYENEHLQDKDLTETGLWIRSLIQGKKPASIPAPADKLEYQHNSLLYRILSTIGGRGLRTAHLWLPFTLCSIVLAGLILFIAYKIMYGKNKKNVTYEDIVYEQKKGHKPRQRALIVFAIVLSVIMTGNYFIWRVLFSIPKGNYIAIAANIILLIFEITGFGETLVHYANMFQRNKHELPHIEDDEYPDVDIFIATYNEDEELLKRTVNGCKHLKYPDLKKVHIWVCDDNRRANIRKFAEKMGVGYFDRPDNEGQKAGNLNAAMARTSAPYVVTLDADMIVRSNFLLKTIPYFVNFEKYNEGKEEKDQVHLGFLQTPQCFYDPDVFQHALYAENNAPNEQDFFYRSIEVAKTSSNSVIYGGSNTVIARRALEAIGGFYTESITEDFATGMLIEAAGFISLATGEPLASGRTPHTFKEHIKQRTRWGRGVIVTAKKTKLFQQKGLSFAQKLNYWSSVYYWYSPIKNFIYITAPLLFALFMIPVFDCNWLEILIYWLPMFLMQGFTLKIISGNSISSKWSGIYETSVMPHLLIPILKEIFGISLTKFAVTDKSANSKIRRTDFRTMLPFIILLSLSAIGLIRVTYLFFARRMFGLITIIFWIIRNTYFLQMAVFLIDGRDSDSDVVKVKDGEPITVKRRVGRQYKQTFEGITTLMTEHNMEVFLDECDDLKVGDYVAMTIDNFTYKAEMKGVVTNITQSRYGGANVYRIEILDFGTDELEYYEILYDRIPTLPQTLHRDVGLLYLIWKNIALRLADTVK